MKKFFGSSGFLIVLLLAFISVENIAPKVHARPCSIFLGHCTDSDVCRQKCNEKYHAPGSCIDQPAGLPRMCMCQKDC
ncbi:hypothetical protein FRX31_019088 [Thalictrum thalictroides]|uniref:Defensin-like protein n=1 Tax=Thalictrum thalictroides TaxID=46969 RepID=A0A7J6W488_THATH|nr:hypothetical protein FRX31_019088 [Thalictrum thalictroides]